MMRAIDMRRTFGRAQVCPDNYSMIRKSGNRFSEKIMLKGNCDRRSPIREERMNAPVTVLKAPQPESVRKRAHLGGPRALRRRLLHRESIPAAVAARAKYLILDAVGIALASTSYDFAHRAMTAISGPCGHRGFRGDRHAGAAADARRGADQRYSGSRPRFRRHPQRRRHSCDGQPAADRAGRRGAATPRARMLRPTLGVEVARARRGRERCVPPGRFPSDRPDWRLRLCARGGTPDGLDEKQLVMAQGLAFRRVPAASSSWRMARGTSASIPAGRPSRDYGSGARAAGFRRRRARL